jgi:hypothetical protein
MSIIVRWQGRPGRVYSFDTYPLGTRFQPFSGVYMACAFRHGTGWTALYVGEAESFQDRLNTDLAGHDGLGRALRGGATHIGMLIVSGETNRQAIEAELRHILKPPYNAQPGDLFGAVKRNWLRG